MNKYLFALSTVLLSLPVFANPAIQQQQAVGYYMSTCGGPTPAHCTGSSGGGNSNGYSDAPVVAAVWAFDNAKASNVPLFYKVYALKGHAYFGEKMMDYGVKHCQETYGGRCKAASYAYGYTYYAAVASTHDKGVNDSTSYIEFDESRSAAKKGALKGCQQNAVAEGFNPKDCKIIYSRKLDSIKSEVPSKTIASEL